MLNLLFLLCPCYSKRFHLPDSAFNLGPVEAINASGATNYVFVKLKDLFFPTPVSDVQFTHIIEPTASTFTVKFDARAIDCIVEPDKVDNTAVEPSFAVDFPEGKCLNYSDNNWKYQFCNKKSLIQYRNLARDGKFYKEEFLLGRFVPRVSEHMADKKRCILGDRYIDGDYCNEISAQREAQIIYTCDEERQNQIENSPAIISIHELSVCKYFLVLHSPQMCSRNSTKSPIRCTSPVSQIHISSDISAGAKHLYDSTKEPIWIQKIFGILEKSDKNFPLIRNAVNNIFNVEDSKLNERLSDIKKWLQLIGFDVDKIVVNQEDKKDDSSEQS